MFGYNCHIGGEKRGRRQKLWKSTRDIPMIKLWIIGHSGFWERRGNLPPWIQEEEHQFKYWPLKNVINGWYLQFEAGCEVLQQAIVRREKSHCRTFPPLICSRVSHQTVSGFDTEKAFKAHRTLIQETIKSIITYGETYWTSIGLITVHIRASCSL